MYWDKYTVTKEGLILQQNADGVRGSEDAHFGVCEDRQVIVK
jgi:hypothetical protein